MPKRPPLTIEKLSESEESKYLIRSPKEIQLTLHAIAQKNAVVVLYFDNEERFLKTIMLGSNEQGIWLDVGPDIDDNTALLNSDNIIFVTMHNGAKVQFACHQVIVAIYASHPAFYFPLPEQMMRLQRREYFRLPACGDVPLKCMIAPTFEKTEKSDEITILDISVGGIALICQEKNINLVAGGIYPDCRIDLPETGTLTVTIQVKNLFDVISPNGAVTKHAGCEFVQLDGKMSMLLQRYIGMMQRKQPTLG